MGRGEFKIRTLSGDEAKRAFDFHKAQLDFHNLFNKEAEEDRNIAIIGGTFLEMALEHILRAFLPEDDSEVDKLFELNQPLNTFSGKISMCYSLGLVEKVVKDDLHIVRKIRNEFAHQLYAEFDHEKIRNWCFNLKWHRVVYMNPPAEATAKQLFQVGVNQLIMNLAGYIDMAGFEKRKIRHDF